MKRQIDCFTPSTRQKIGKDGLKTITILTLEEHKDGVWITRLVDALSDVASSATVQVVTLESMLANMDPSQALFSSCLLVNRVSDAAAPPLQKACVGVLQLAANVFKIRVWNGPTSYSLCCNKWCQHVLFAQAGLECPQTQVLLNASQTSLQEAISSVQGKEKSLVVLLKPNAGGFGAGVKRIDPNANASDQTTLDTTVSNYADGVTLVQEYIETDSIYRVWFLNGKVQCGIVRKNVVGGNEFSSACMASTCTRQKPSNVHAYPISSDVRRDLEEKLLPLLPDAHSGSVEFLYNENGTRLYFDLNLLSTLPLVENVQDADKEWGKDYDPWKEMAVAMAGMVS